MDSCRAIKTKYLEKIKRNTRLHGFPLLQLLKRVTTTKTYFPYQVLNYRKGSFDKDFLTEVNFNNLGAAVDEMNWNTHRTRMVVRFPQQNRQNLRTTIKKKERK